MCAYINNVYSNAYKKKRHPIALENERGVHIITFFFRGSVGGVYRRAAHITRKERKKNVISLLEWGFVTAPEGIAWPRRRKMARKEQNLILVRRPRPSLKTTWLRHLPIRSSWCLHSSSPEIIHAWYPGLYKDHLDKNNSHQRLPNHIFNGFSLPQGHVSEKVGEKKKKGKKKDIQPDHHYELFSHPPVRRTNQRAEGVE